MLYHVSEGQQMLKMNADKNGRRKTGNAKAEKKEEERKTEHGKQR